MIDEEKAAEIHGHGWAFYFSDPEIEEFHPRNHSGSELVEWIESYAAALADYRVRAAGSLPLQAAETALEGPCDPPCWVWG